MTFRARPALRIHRMAVLLLLVFAVAPSLFGQSSIADKYKDQDKRPPITTRAELDATTPTSANPYVVFFRSKPSLTIATGTPSCDLTLKTDQPSHGHRPPSAKPNAASAITPSPLQIRQQPAQRAPAATSPALATPLRFLLSQHRNLESTTPSQRPFQLW